MAAVVKIPLCGGLALKCPILVPLGALVRRKQVVSALMVLTFPDRIYTMTLDRHRYPRLPQFFSALVYQPQ